MHEDYATSLTLGEDVAIVNTYAAQGPYPGTRRDRTVFPNVACVIALIDRFVQRKRRFNWLARRAGSRRPPSVKISGLTT
jgi:hypothetical protein